MNDLLRKIPKVDDILRAKSWQAMNAYPEGLAKESLRLALEALRMAIKEGETAVIPPVQTIIEEAMKRADLVLAPALKKVINGTGIIIHTNLGRSLLAPSAIERMKDVASGYSNLEFDLVSGKRGDRYEHCRALLCRVTGAPSALIVNNNAAAVFLALNTLAQGKEVIIARGELIEIGGSFRIPEIMARSGAILREVGATNRTYVKDYEKAISDATGLIMKAHPSNYRIRGFVHEATSDELAALASRRHVPFYFDTGSGALAPFSQTAQSGEPLTQDEIGKNVDLISFSGDKLLGGPQAGILLGKTHVIDALKANPLARVLRADKFTLAALEATLLLYLDMDKAFREIPTLSMLSEEAASVKKRAARVVRPLSKALPTDSVAIVKLQSEVGGGSMPDVQLPSYGFSLRFSSMTVDDLSLRLRSVETPVIGRIEKDLFLVDMRTVRKEDEKALIAAVKAVIQDG